MQYVAEAQKKPILSHTIWVVNLTQDVLSGSDFNLNYNPPSFSILLQGTY